MGLNSKPLKMLMEVEEPEHEPEPYPYPSDLEEKNDAIEKTYTLADYLKRVKVDALKAELKSLEDSLNYFLDKYHSKMDGVQVGIISGAICLVKYAEFNEWHADVPLPNNIINIFKKEITTEECSQDVPISLKELNDEPFGFNSGDVIDMDEVECLKYINE